MNDVTPGTTETTTNPEENTSNAPAIEEVEKCWNLLHGNGNLTFAEFDARQEAERKAEEEKRVNTTEGLTTHAPFSQPRDYGIRTSHWHRTK